MSLKLETMTAADVDEAVSLVERAMNADEGAWARRGFEFHFGCERHGLDDGREYLLWRCEGRIRGLVGLHCYIWGPPGNVWLGWFAVDPDLHGQGAGGRLIDAAQDLAAERGYKKFFVETYESDTFAKARRFYRRKGFTRLGRIEKYLPDGEAMVVFGKDLTP